MSIIVPGHCGVIAAAPAAFTSTFELKINEAPTHRRQNTKAIVTNSGDPCCLLPRWAPKSTCTPPDPHSMCVWSCLHRTKEYFFLVSASACWRPPLDKALGWFFPCYQPCISPIKTWCHIWPYLLTLVEATSDLNGLCGIAPTSPRSVQKCIKSG